MLVLVAVSSILFCVVVCLVFKILRLERINKEMDVVYATLIINGKKKFSQVPALIKERVRQALIDLDLEELTQE